jgi:GAF domain-containing protein
VSVNEGKNLWERWEKAIKDYKTARENFDSEWLHDWPRRLLVLFMEQISKNTLQGNFDALLDKIIEALQIACGFERVRIYFIDEKKTDELVLHKTSIGHQPLLNNFRINIDEKDHGDAIKTLKSGNPLSIEDVSDAYLYLQEQLNITGPYAAIPLLIEGKPYGLVAADKTPSDERCKKEKKPVQFYEYQEHFEAFARVIMSAIENRKISDQRRQKIVQLESINKIDEIIQSEDEEEKLLKSLTEYSGQLVNADGGHLKIKNTRTEKLERVASYGQDITPEEIKDKPEHIGFSNHVFQTKQPLLLGDVTTHEIMQRHKEYCRENGYAEYLKCLENRKSALIVPLITRKDKIIGVLDLHARKENQFSEADKENLEILVNSVIHALDKVQQIKEQKDLFLQREKVIQVMHEAMGKTDHLPSLLEIIRNSIFNSEIFKDIEILCLSLKNPQSGELRPASSKCAKSGKDCDICMTNRQVVIDSLEKKELQYGDRELALPILSKREPIGVLYLKDKNEIILTGNEKKLFV